GLILRTVAHASGSDGFIRAGRVSDGLILRTVAPASGSGGFIRAGRVSDGLILGTVAPASGSDGLLKETGLKVCVRGTIASGGAGARSANDDLPSRQGKEEAVMVEQASRLLNLESPGLQERGL